MPPKENKTKKARAKRAVRLKKQGPRPRKGGLQRPRPQEVFETRKYNNEMVGQSAVVGVGSYLTHTFSIARYYDGKNKGAVMTGCVPFAAANYQGLSSDLLFSGYGNTGFTKTVPLNPFAIFPALSNELNIASTYTKYRFRKLKVVFTTAVNTGVVGSMYFGYFPDGAVQSSDVTNTFMIAQPGTAAAPVWATNVGTDVTEFLDRDTWYYVDEDVAVADDAALRQSYQGAITGKWRILPTPIQQYGDFFIDYSLELAEPRTPIDLALTKVPQEVRRAFGQRKRADVKKELEVFASSYVPPVVERKAEVKDSGEPVMRTAPASVMGETVTYQLQPLAVDDVIPVPQSKLRK